MKEKGQFQVKVFNLAVKHAMHILSSQLLYIPAP